MPCAAVYVDELVYEQLLAVAHRSGGQECCGLLLGRAPDRVEEIMISRNIAEEPERHFEILPQDLIAAEKEMRRGGRLLLGYYHSHPVGEAVPSPTDAVLSAGDGRIWAIIAGATVRLWRNEPGGTLHDMFTEITCHVGVPASDET